MRTLYLCLLPLAVLAGEPANSIHGTVLDPSARPVEGARIGCGGHVVFSNAEGRFSLATGEACDGKIEKAGFQAASNRLTPQGENRITLAIQGPAETVVVSATRAQATPEEAAVAANVITAHQIESLDFPIVADLLRDLPGMSVVESGRRGGLTDVFTRGADSTATLVLLDGVPVNDPGGQVNLAHISSTGIDRIEVVRGPESALFGAEASAGVIQLFTKRGNSEDAVPHGFVEYERGNFQTDRWMAGLSGGFGGRLDYSLNADEIHTANEYPNDFYRDNTGSANVGYRISDATQVRGIFRIYDAHLGSPGQVAFGAVDTIANEETRDTSAVVRVDDSRGARFFQSFSFGYHHLHDLYNDNEPYSSQSLAALVRDASGGRDYFVSLLNPNALPLPGQIPAGTQVATATAYFGPYGSLNLTERKTADYQGTFTHKGGALVFGYSYQRQSGNVGGTNVSRDHDGLFFNEQYNWGSRVYLDAGGRFEYSSAFGSTFAPRAGVSFLLLHEHGIASSTSLRLSAGRGITEPSLLENYIQEPPYEIGNPGLKPEKTNTYEAAVVQYWFGRRVRTELAAFRSSFKDLITYVGPSWQNIEASWARGLEFSSEAKLWPNLLVRGSYTRLFTDITSSVSGPGTDTSVGQTLLRRPPNSGAVSLSYTPKRWVFVMGGRFMGERHDSDFTFGVNRNPAYQNVYLTASYNLTRHFTPELRLDNLLNENYQEVLGYPALSRSILGGVRIGW
jgi:outer membrane cobalamin receptor